MQKMTPNPDGTLPYKGPVDCAMQTLTKEGPLKFYTGERRERECLAWWGAPAHPNCPSSSARSAVPESLAFARDLLGMA